MTLKSGLFGCVAISGLMAVAPGVFAQCMEAVLAPGKAGYSVCKDWPAYPGQTITAISQLEGDPAVENAYDEGMYDLALAVVPSDGGVPLASYFRASLFSSDAIRFNGLSIDTARYTLTPQVRAFGVRAEFRGSSRANPFGETWLSLYVKEGKTLRPVLESLIVESHGGEWDTNCAGEFWETRRTLEMASTRSHGYADLIVRSVASGSKSTRKGEECEGIPSTGKTVLTTLRYDGNQYVVIDGMKGKF
ncbi:hypothetical protein ACQKQA_08800 [Pseudomonas sp. NPDC089530]|uniref:hypothetical protein n=1 Tax=Pseudomonas sp. NPDC089530 TaxID=3390651 RepID=UPI003CFF3AF8